ncbi:putative adhesin [Roseomonas sp. CAU 1739]|uniref:putative adhesin n=1 Tax=Roseomonas sp. CAU 1739 TaxID=3140364 RepID=UPI00325B8E4D
MQRTDAAHPPGSALDDASVALAVSRDACSFMRQGQCGHNLEHQIMSFGSVVSGFFDHLSDVHSSASMDFAQNSSPVTKLTNYYLIGNSTGKTSCYIICHGGHFEKNYFMDNMTFTVPQGVTVSFFHDHGDIFSYSYNRFGSGDPSQLPLVKVSDGKKVYAAGEACENYMLNKFHGRHGANENYQDLQNLAAPGDHLFVVVRNRWFSAGVSLKDCIAAVREAVPTVTTFLCMFCRATEDSTNWYSATAGENKPV